MKFDVKIDRGRLSRVVEVDAPHGAAARAIGQAICEEGEVVAPGESAVYLASQRGVEGAALMSPDHARNVATGRREMDSRCTCAMTEASMRSCEVHGEDGNVLCKDCRCELTAEEIEAEAGFCFDCMPGSGVA